MKPSNVFHSVVGIHSISRQGPTSSTHWDFTAERKRETMRETKRRLRLSHTVQQGIQLLLCTGRTGDQLKKKPE